MYHEYFRCIFNLDPGGPLDSEVMQKLVSRDLAMNIFQNGDWGSYRHRQLHTGELEAEILGEGGGVRSGKGPQTLEVMQKLVSRYLDMKCTKIK